MLRSGAAFHPRESSGSRRIGKGQGIRPERHICDRLPGEIYGWQTGLGFGETGQCAGECGPERIRPLSVG